jgi:hypothetical protein
MPCIAREHNLFAVSVAAQSASFKPQAPHEESLQRSTSASSGGRGRLHAVKEHVGADYSVGKT